MTPPERCNSLFASVVIASALVTVDAELHSVCCDDGHATLKLQMLFNPLRAILEAHAMVLSLGSEKIQQAEQIQCWQHLAQIMPKVVCFIATVPVQMQFACHQLPLCRVEESRRIKRIRHVGMD
ncbi:unnamed protein product [Ostreobium quekettii]|uniref:Secreted protein n=1 Tax=Ostreobium quekettii TaxID=121088 RepID=A0A8S1J950_9CHLO|nr:unnamed protein product [Ostreobium quekettii]